MIFRVMKWAVVAMIVTVLLPDLSGKRPQSRVPDLVKTANKGAPIIFCLVLAPCAIYAYLVILWCRWTVLMRALVLITRVLLLDSRPPKTSLAIEYMEENLDLLSAAASYA